MTNREVRTEVEEMVAKHYPRYDDTETFRIDINQAVKMVKFELGMSHKMAVYYVRGTFSAYSPKVGLDD
jgi:hypothetical protein